jgi:hypothetical protein
MVSQETEMEGGNNSRHRQKAKLRNNVRSTAIVNDVLSLWRSSLDAVALSEAYTLWERQPRCAITYNEDFSKITVYNYLAYGANNGGGGPSSNNDTAMTDMVNAMTPPTAKISGGTAIIEQYQFPIDAPTSGDGYAIADQSAFLGLGTGGYTPSNTFAHFVISGSGGSAGSPFIFFNCAPASHTSGGNYFKYLAFSWSDPSTGYETCIYADNWNCRAEYCNFVNCPTAFYAVGLSCGLSQCTIQYLKDSPDNATAVYLQGVECFVTGPGEFRQDSVVSKSGPTGCTAISLGGGSSPTVEHAIISYIHLSDWSYGISYKLQAGVYGTHVTNVEAECLMACVYMRPPASEGKIFGEKYTSCLFAKSHDSNDGTAIVLIDTNGATNTDNINDIEFVNCTVIGDTSTPQAGQYCYQITSGSNIRIIGGTISNAGNGNGSAGIAITPPIGGSGAGPGRITVLGADLGANYPQAKYPHSQEFALLISADITDTVTIDNCKMKGYGSASPVQITGSVATNTLFITNCEGYNDQNTPLNGTVPPVTPTSAATSSTPYFGPSVVTFQSGTTVGVTVFGTTIGLSAGVIFLPSPYDSISFSTAPSIFSWYGR